MIKYFICTISESSNQLYKMSTKCLICCIDEETGSGRPSSRSTEIQTQVCLLTEARPFLEHVSGTLLAMTRWCVCVTGKKPNWFHITKTPLKFSKAWLSFRQVASQLSCCSFTASLRCTSPPNLLNTVFLVWFTFWCTFLWKILMKLNFKKGDFNMSSRHCCFSWKYLKDWDSACWKMVSHGSVAFSCFFP